MCKVLVGWLTLTVLYLWPATSDPALADPSKARSTGSHYVRPYGPNAPWNVETKFLPHHPNPERYVKLLWTKAPSNRAGNFNISTEDYTYPVYEVKDATLKVNVDARDDVPISGETIPWNPNWRPAPGSDGQVILLDPEKGKEWNLWQVRSDSEEGEDFALRVSNGSRVPGDYRTREVGYRPSRGVGIPYLAMLVRPEEIAQGEISHALSMPIRHPDGFLAVPPATKVEGKVKKTGIPEGMRFAISITNAEIDTWIDALPKQLPASTRRSAKIIATALRDYGWFITDTAGGASFQFEARVSAGTEWDQLGLGRIKIGENVYPRDLLDGLLTPERIYVIVPSDQYPKKHLARQR